MNFVIPVEKLSDDTIKMIAKDLGCLVEYSEESQRLIDEGVGDGKKIDINKIEEGEDKYIAELKEWLLDNNYIIKERIYTVKELYTTEWEF